MKAKHTGFTLVELLVVLGIIGVLIGLLMPSMRKARMASQQTVCASNLRQVGAALLLYVNDNQQKLPFVVEPLWRPDGSVDLNADPSDPVASPQSFMNVMKRYIGEGKILMCPAAATAYPAKDPKVSYRISSANNYDGQIKYIEDLFTSTGPRYDYSLKYLNGRNYQVRHVNMYELPFKLVKGAGPHPLLRDLTAKPPGAVKPLTPHPNRQYNQLKLDMSVVLERDPDFQVPFP